MISNGFNNGFFWIRDKGNLHGSFCANAAKALFELRYVHSPHIDIKYNINLIFVI